MLPLSLQGVIGVMGRKSPGKVDALDKMACHCSIQSNDIMC